MQQSNSSIMWLLAGITGICALGWLTHTYPPSHSLIIASFFFLIFATIFSFIFFICKSPKQPFLLASFGTIFFLLRYANLREPIYTILLTACLVSLEVLFQKH